MGDGAGGDRLLVGEREGGDRDWYSSNRRGLTHMERLCNGTVKGVSLDAGGEEGRDIVAGTQPRELAVTGGCFPDGGAP